MNWWVYLGYMFISLIGALLFLFVCLCVFICIDNYYEDKKENEDDKS